MHGTSRKARLAKPACIAVSLKYSRAPIALELFAGLPHGQADEWHKNDAIHVDSRVGHQDQPREPRVRRCQILIAV